MYFLEIAIRNQYFRLGAMCLNFGVKI